MPPVCMRSCHITTSHIDKNEEAEMKGISYRDVWYNLPFNYYPFPASNVDLVGAYNTTTTASYRTYITVVVYFA